jgi:4-hydroxy-tetrahydrodipicolinate reductase
VTVLGTGVNPGFVMDLLPVVLSSVCRQVQRVAVQRVVDASTRRRPLQRKVGAGMAREEFAQQAAQGGLGHVGLVESVALLADTLGFPVDRITQELQPHLATGPLPWADGVIHPGQVTGIDQRARGLMGDEVVLDLHLEMYLGAEFPHDRIVITGDPGLTVMVEGGTAGDAATVGTVVNWIPRVVPAPPGLVTVKDLAPPEWRTGSVMRET